MDIQRAKQLIDRAVEAKKRHDEATRRGATISGATFRDRVIASNLVGALSEAPNGRLDVTVRDENGDEIFDEINVSTAEFLSEMDEVQITPADGPREQGIDPDVEFRTTLREIVREANRYL